MAKPATDIWSQKSAYDEWAESQGIPIHKGFYIEDTRTLQLGRWEERGCNGAFLQLAGQEGVSEARVTEIPPGKTLPPLRFALDEIVYVVEGRGLTTIWADGKPKKTFEWHRHSLFLLPRNYIHELSNAQGNRPVRLLHYNYLPLTMTTIPDAKFFFNNPYVDLKIVYGQENEFYSVAKAVRETDGPSEWHAKRRRQRNVWFGNFFPDLGGWDKLEVHAGRGAGGHLLLLKFPHSVMKGHMSVFPMQTYKKAHRHGPGVVIVIPAGEGYSIMWQEGKEKIVIPWHEASVFVPPNRWFHQHFNVGAIPARYLAFHSPEGLVGYSEKVADREKDQIEYPDEGPWVREKFEAELAKRGLNSLMPEGAYRDKNFEWEYQEA